MIRAKIIQNFCVKQRRLLWFASLWLGGVVSLTLIAAAIKGFMYSIGLQL